MTEIELKLEVADAAKAGETLPGLFPGAPTIAEQSSVYFDTPDHALLKAGLSLRLRTADGRCVQTVKASGGAGAGLFERSEWERPVSDGKPVLDAGTPVLAALDGKADAIEPVFDVRVERRTWLIHDAGATVEVVLDAGEVTSGKRRSSVSELELELKDGPIAALFDLARRIDRDVPVRLGVLSKAERGYRLSRRPRGRFKAEAVDLPPDARVAEAFRRIAQSCLRHYRLNEDLVLQNGGVEAVHQARVAIRRLRSAFSIFKPVLATDTTAAALRGELRWLACELGELRNLDVLLADAPAGPVHERLAAERSTVFEAVKAVLASHRARALMLDLVQWLVDGEWLHGEQSDPGKAPAREFAAAALDRMRRRIRKRGGALETADDEMRHEVRKDAKRLRYGAEFFAPLFADKRSRRRHKHFIAALEELQDHLGALNDIATAPEVLRKLDLPDGAAALPGSDPKKKDTLVRAAAEAQAGLMAAKRFWKGSGAKASRR